MCRLLIAQERAHATITTFLQCIHHLHPATKHLHHTLPHQCAGAHAQIRYEHLAPLAGVVDVKGIWQALKLPQLPPTFCHVGLLGWHCHNTTKQPWDPSSLIPKDQLPPMPANASCVICPPGWHGTRRNLIDVLIDLPFVQGKSQLPKGFYDMVVLKAGDSKAHNGTASQVVP